MWTWCGSLLVLGVVAVHPAAAGATPLETLRYSPDVTIRLGGLWTVDDAGLVLDDLAGSREPLGLGTLPAAADVDGYHRLWGGQRLLSFDGRVELSSGWTAMPGDIVLFDGGGPVKYFDAAAAGLPVQANVDAFTVIEHASGQSVLLLSLDGDLSLPGSVVVADEDLFSIVDGRVEIWFDGSEAGVPAGLDVDAAHFLRGNGHVLLSFDVGGTLGGFSFDDEDLLEYDPFDGTWQLAHDLSSADASWMAVDLDAVHARAVDDDGDGTGRGDCDDFDAEVWASPGAIRSLYLEHGGGHLGTTTLRWEPPVDPGSRTLFYDVLASNAAGFSAGASCLESNDTDTEAQDTTRLAAGTTLFFLARAGNRCGRGSLGEDSRGIERSRGPCFRETSATRTGGTP